MGEKSYMSLKAVLIICVAAFLLQAILSANIRIGGIGPDFMLVAVVFVGLRSDPPRAAIVGFIMGILYDFMGSGPVGIMALTLTLAGFVLALAMRNMEFDNLLSSLLVIAVAIIASEVFYGILCCIAGEYGSFFKSIIYRMIPSALYDFVFALIAYLIGYLISRRRGGQGNSGDASAQGFSAGPSMGASSMGTSSRRGKSSTGMPSLGSSLGSGLGSMKNSSKGGRHSSGGLSMGGSKKRGKKGM